MKRVFIIVSSVALACSVATLDATAGRGKVVTKTRELAEFDRIDFRLAGDFYVTIGEATPLEITGEPKTIESITTEVKGGRLVVSAKSTLKTKEKLEFRIGVKDLKGVDLRGSGDFHVDKLDNQRFDLTIKGSGDVLLVGKTKELKVRISGSGAVGGSEFEAGEVSIDAKGSGDVKLSVTGSAKVAMAGSGDVSLTGKADRLIVDITGSGDFDGSKLEAREVSVAIKGSGDAKVAPTQSLSVAIIGSGDVSYSGNPTLSKVTVGSGSVRKSE